MLRESAFLCEGTGKRGLISFACPSVGNWRRYWMREVHEGTHLQVCSSRHHSRPLEKTETASVLFTLDTTSS